ncbi:MAG: gamma-glutamyltransferase [Pseudomonadota bacterium]
MDAVNRRLSRLCLARVAALLLAALPALAPAQGALQSILRYPSLTHPVSDPGGMVASQSKLATAVGARVLAAGGNAVDAAVAVGFALAVTLPRAGNIGGGGFMLVYLAEEKRTVAIDYRETAPAAATRDMFLDADGNADSNASRFTRAAAGVPGTVAGLHHAHRRYGSLEWAELLAPAIELAADGIVVSDDLSASLQRSRARMSPHPASVAAFFKADGSSYRPGEALRQPDLANSLRLIAEQGPAAFYEGDIAALIVADMAANGGLITAEDLAAYRVVEREPVYGNYRGYEVVSMPPPSSGGVHVVQMLNVLERFPLGDYGPASAATLHTLVEVMRTAYADRSKYLGDPDFFDVPAGWLTSEAYAERVAAAIPRDKARRSADVGPGRPAADESPDTTHYSIADADGNVVANTYTLNFSYGSGITVPGTGMLLNNEMDDFSAKPGVPNAFGLLGGEANAIEPRKRPLSSMTPTLLFRGGRPVLVTGSPGGSRIITTVLQQIVNIADFGMNLSDSIYAPRLHHQWYPDIVFHERGFSPDTLKLLRDKGHTLTPTPFGMGSLQSIAIDDGVFHGASDPRRPDAGAAGPASVRCERQAAACGF